MSNEKLLDFRAKEYEFLKTNIGKKFYAMMNAHGTVWAQEYNENVSPKKLEVLTEQSDRAKATFREELDKLIDKANMYDKFRAEVSILSAKIDQSADIHEHLDLMIEKANMYDGLCK